MFVEFEMLAVEAEALLRQGLQHDLTASRKAIGALVDRHAEGGASKLGRRRSRGRPSSHGADACRAAPPPRRAAPDERARPATPAVPMRNASARRGQHAHHMHRTADAVGREVMLAATGTKPPLSMISMRSSARAKTSSSGVADRATEELQHHQLFMVIRP